MRQPRSGSWSGRIELAAAARQQDKQKKGKQKDDTDKQREAGRESHSKWPACIGVYQELLQARGEIGFWRSADASRGTAWLRVLMCASALAGAVPAHSGRRVSGHQPGERAACAASCRGWTRPVGGRGSKAGDLSFSGRVLGQRARLRAGLSGRAARTANAQLPVPAADCRAVRRRMPRRMSGTAATFADWQPQRAMDFEEAQHIKEAQHISEVQEVQGAQTEVPASAQMEGRTQQVQSEPRIHAQAGATTNSLPAVTLAIADDEDAQADGIWPRTIQSYAARGVSHGDQVILCHTHRQAARLAELLGARGNRDTAPQRFVRARRDQRPARAACRWPASRKEPPCAASPAFEEYAIPPDDALTCFCAPPANRGSRSPPP